MPERQSAERLRRAERDDETVKRVYGERIKRGEIEIIPVASVRRCSCPGKDGDSRCGCFSISPIGLVVFREDEVVWRSAVDRSRLAFALAAGLGLALALRRRCS
jgi:hypothetical protein